MKRFLSPDHLFGTYRDITPEFLQKNGIRALVADIDNTLAPYAQAEPDEALCAWLGALQDAGIRIALISNNKPERVHLFNRNLGLPVYPDAGKPHRKYLRIALAEMGIPAKEAAMLGDQLLTDALAGNRMGMRVLIVPPIKNDGGLFFRCKRLIEKPVIRRFRRTHPENIHISGTETR